MLWNYKNLGIINSMLPNSYIIHIVRDPLDTLLSCYKNRFMGAANAWTLVCHTCIYTERSSDILSNLIIYIYLRP